MSVPDLERLPALLATRVLGRSLEVHHETTSTMDDARIALMHGAATGHVVVADRQTGGRGTHGRVWSSPSGQDLYVSFVARPRMHIERLPTLALAAGLGIARGIGCFVDPSRVRLKWPNDILVDGAKCVGVLVETRATADGVDGVVVGFGINVNRLIFEVDAVPTPTSLALANGGPLDRVEVLARVLEHLETTLLTWEREPLPSTLDPIVAMLAYRGETVRVDGVGEPGTVVGLAEDGGLTIETPTGRRTIQAGRIERFTNDATKA